MRGRLLRWLVALASSGALTVRLVWAASPQTSAGRPQGPAGAGGAIRTAQEVFAGPEFWWKHTQQVDATSWTWFGNILAWLSEHVWGLLVKLIKWFLGVHLGMGDWSSGLPLMWLAVAVVGGWALWRLVPHIGKWWAGRSLPANASAAVAVQEKLAEARVLLQRAQAALRTNHSSEAVRLAFLALLAWLQERGALHYDPSRTNREYRRDLQQQPELAAAFQEVARPFERIWYGGYPADQPETERVISLCQSLVEPEEGVA